MDQYFDDGSYAPFVRRQLLKTATGVVVNYAVYNTLNAVNNEHLLTLLTDANTVSTINSILVVTYPTAVALTPVSASTSGGNGGNDLSSGGSLSMTPSYSPTTAAVTTGPAKKNYDNYVFIGASVLGGIMLLGMGGGGLYYLKKKRDKKNKIKMEAELAAKPSVQIFQEPSSPFAYGHSPVLPNQDPEDDDDGDGEIKWGKYTSRLDSLKEEDEENVEVSSIHQKPYTKNRYGISSRGGDRWQPSANLWAYDSDDNSSNASRVHSRVHSADGGSSYSPSLMNVDNDHTTNPQRIHRLLTDAVSKVSRTYTIHETHLFNAMYSPHPPSSHSSTLIIPIHPHHPHPPSSHSSTLFKYELLFLRLNNRMSKGDTLAVYL